jgi:teichuronic acid biosynthesis glycosyltransferase TuaC
MKEQCYPNSFRVAECRSTRLEPQIINYRKMLVQEVIPSRVEGDQGIQGDSLLRVLVLSKRQYMKKDLLDDRFGRFREIPLGLAERGHSVKGLCLSYDHRNEGWTPDGPVHWKSINATRFKLPGLARFVAEAVKLATNADVIWACSDSFYGMIGCYVGWRCKIPSVFDIYDNFEAFFVGRLPVLRQLYKAVARKSDAVTCFSRRMAMLVRSYGRRNRTIVLENAANQDLFKPMDKIACRKALRLPAEAVLVGTAGALYRNRGVNVLFDAFFEFSKRHPEVHLALAGPRDQKLPIPSNPRIHDLGVLPHAEVPRFLNALDVAVICYADSELGEYSFPYKAREIMACDVPLIAARVGSMQEILEAHPEWLYDPNDWEDLARVLERRLEDRRTAYGRVMSWEEASIILENILSAVVRRTAGNPLKG